jgi:hypothetical protein
MGRDVVLDSSHDFRSWHLADMDAATEHVRC